MHFGTPIPISAAFALTRKEYSILGAVSKTKPRHVSDEVFEVMWSDAIS